MHESFLCVSTYYVSVHNGCDLFNQQEWIVYLSFHAWLGSVHVYLPRATVLSSNYLKAGYSIAIRNPGQSL